MRVTAARTTSRIDAARRIELRVCRDNAHQCNNRSAQYQSGLEVADVGVSRGSGDPPHKF